MNYKYTFYFQEHNTLFSGPALSICYKASQDEISHFVSYNTEMEFLYICHKKDKAGDCTIN